MNNTKKVLGLAIAVVALVGVSVMGTVAYLTDTTTEVKNSFTVGNVAITLDEAKVDEDGKEIIGTDAERVYTNSYHLIPGNTYDKDPTVTVEADSEECYVFITVDNGLAGIEGTGETDTIAAQIAENGWSLVSGYTNLYQYKTTVTGSTVGVGLSVFKTVSIADSVTGEDLTNYKDATITINACAIQAEGFEDAAGTLTKLPADFISGAIATATDES